MTTNPAVHLAAQGPQLSNRAPAPSEPSTAAPNTNRRAHERCVQNRGDFTGTSARLYPHSRATAREADGLLPPPEPLDFLVPAQGRPSVLLRLEVEIENRPLACVAQLALG